MFDKLQGIEDKYNEITQELSNPEVIADQERFQRLAKLIPTLARSWPNLVNINKFSRG